MQLEEMEDRVSRHHGDVKDEMNVPTVMQVQCFNLEEVGRMALHELVLVGLCIPGSGVKDVSQLLAVKQINGEMPKVGGLECMCQLLDM